ncbi:MAG: Aspartyl/glutamyl-tRNA(Asn/Gln) amidotransferase subunit C [Firmicutes bacterium ADurb.Bin456]|nr:MAG: Aspartyl/glutamyl-tRNA(Asn/Gln) amidotransferase subunit C [Firmicutes bacterium ADurb.Bin456]
MKISEREVEQLAFLSRLDLKAEELAAYTGSLNAVLGYLELVNKLDTSAIEPAAHVLPFKNILREDRLQGSLDKELVLANAPEVEEGSFVVPRIV